MRLEKDSMGTIEVPEDAAWGAQTARSLRHFAIGREKMPEELIFALTIIKKACAITNHHYELITASKKEAICKACDEILTGKLSSQFPLSVWQTGSGTQSNMNVNEVIAHNAELIAGTSIHPNDDVNRSQSTNDVFPSAIHIAVTTKLVQNLLPALTRLEKSLRKKAKAFGSIIKVGRTHFMDATPLTLGQEFSGYAAQLAADKTLIKNCLKELYTLALGGTAVGTGLNAPKGFGKQVCKTLRDLQHQPYRPAKNYFAALAASDSLVQLSGTLKTVSCSLFKIANDIRFLSSGPRCGVGELSLPENEPGSSIMPGKVNPTQCEALIMICIQAFGNDTAIGFAGSQGNCELNVCRPLIAYNILQTIRLLTDGMNSFCTYCVDGIKPEKKRIQEHLENSLMQATALTPLIGYDAASKIVQKAHKDDVTIKQAAIELGFFSEPEFDKLNLFTT